MTTRNWQLIPPAQAVIELTELVAANERKYRDTLSIANAAHRVKTARLRWDQSGSDVAWREMQDAREALDALLATWRPE